MPGEDVREGLQIVLGEVGEIAYVPELPARGTHAGMVGRSLAMLENLGVDLQPAGWRLTAGESRDQRRARSLLAHDLDLLEELLPRTTPTVKQQVAGPWSLAAMVERPRGDRALGDHGARRDLAESLAAGLAVQIADLRRRAPQAELVVQVDEPMLPAVLAGAVPTASGYGRHRPVDDHEADRLLSIISTAITTSDATPVAHCCARDVPVDLLAGAGFGGISFDLSLVEPGEAWASAFEAGVDLWPGAVPTAGHLPSATDLRRRVDRWFTALGFDDAAYGERSVVTPACGLANSTLDHARAALTLARQAASTV